MNKAELGWVYVVTHANAKGLFKIGITRNPANRKNQLGGDDLTVLAMVLNWNPERAEKRLHERFKALRLPQSEWFNLSKEDVAELTLDLADQHSRVMAYVVDPTVVSVEDRTLIRDWIETSWNSGTWASLESFKEEKQKPEEPKWDQAFGAWRYTDKEGDACIANSLQEAVNNQ